MKTGLVEKGKVIVVLFLFTVTLKPSVSQALEPLLEKLKQKGILTKDEAFQIEKETEKKQVKLPKGLEGLSIGALAYIDYSVGNKLSGGRQLSYNQFALTRGYINIKKEITPWLSVRITPDIKQETAGDTDAKLYGSWVTRMKYYYAQFNWPDLGFLTNNKTELGMGHMAWLDFQEHINPYRCQGTMFQERFHGFNSADLGVSLMGYFGGEMDEEYKKNVTKYYAGKYGSYHLGVYNGAGYHASENNNNKVLEYRVTIRLLPDILPGLQLTYFGLTAKGNSATYTGSNAPDWRISTGFISYDAKDFTLTAEACRNKGNQAGTWLATGNNPKSVEGYSFFGFVRIPGLEKMRVHARYDHFDPNIDIDDDDARLLIAGLSYDVYRHNMAMLNYERFEYDRNNKSGGLTNADNYEHRVQFVYQISF